jgi:hypothetical protein
LSASDAESKSVDRSTKAKAPRDLRIDFLRGFFILYLCGSHFTWFSDVIGYTSQLRFHGMNTVGLSSPAEFFVFFSGYVMALVLARNAERIGFWLTQARALDRAWNVYVLNAFSFAVVAGCASFLFDSQSKLYTTTGIDRLVAHPTDFIRDFMTFQDNLAFFEILRNYIFFIPLIGVFLWLSRVRLWLPLLFSFGVWLAHQVGLTAAFAYPTFNPFAWQFLFFLGATIAVWRPLHQWRFPRRNLQIALCLTLLAGALAFRIFAFPEIPADYIPGANKTDVGPLRLIHAALVLWAALLLLPSSEWLGRFSLARSVIAVGQNSLECFCLSSVMVYLGAHFMGHSPQSIPLYWTVLTSLIATELVAARLFAWFKAEPWRSAA